MNHRVHVRVETKIYPDRHSRVIRAPPRGLQAVGASSAPAAGRAAGWLTEGRCVLTPVLEVGTMKIMRIA